ncbi:uncharacterized protein A4U43_UnF7780 [Asparagus officinalis]|uniref:Uncharacterized protein n=1 Tax=Asparagus officinalis TaxID=4686 RepID=A0A1R3L651_ASPOF|nr:uncharacterized protein A4U43_UnF7780 [Asparagus officinalis]
MGPVSLLEDKLKVRKRISESAGDGPSEPVGGQVESEELSQASYSRGDRARKARVSDRELFEARELGDGGAGYWACEVREVVEVDVSEDGEVADDGRDWAGYGGTLRPCHCGRSRGRFHDERAKGVPKIL